MTDDLPLEILLPRGQGRPTGQSEKRHLLTVERAFDEADLEVLINGRPEAPSTQAIQRLRNSHHRLARLLAGGANVLEASALSGYSPDRVAALQSKDPTFRELIAFYAAQEEEIVANVVERMTTLGLNALDELQHRLEEDPDKWTRTELMQLSELMLAKNIAAAVGAKFSPTGRAFGLGQSSPSVEVSIKFVEPSGRLLDVTPQPSAGEASPTDGR